MLRYQGIVSRIIAINVHVLNEVWIGGRWRVVDPDYNAVFDYSLREIEDRPELVLKPYFDLGLKPDQVNELKSFFATKEDNWHYINAPSYAMWDYFFERMALILVWLIPIGLFGLGVLMRLLARPRTGRFTKRSTGPQPYGL